jgi:diguanylate cyclase (GGDEF)-like protein
MAAPDWFQKILLNDEDDLADLRVRIMKPVSLVAAGLLMVLVINNMLQGRWPMALAVLFVVVTLLANVRGLRPGHKPPVPYVLVLLPGLIAMLFSISQQGIYGALWSYPLTLISYFVLSRRTALVFSLGVIVSVSVAVGLWIGVPLALRVLATLVLSAVMINVVLNLLGELQASLLRQTLIDPLTGAFNRRYMDQAVGLAVELGRRHKPTNTLLSFDIDHFKRVNDSFGHDAGDEVLRRVVQVVRMRLRKVDPLFRTGGEEFMVLLRDTDAAGAAAVAEDLRRRIEQEALLPGEVITISLGVGPQVAGQSVEEWVKATDQALYRAKNAGRNRVEMAAAAA